MKYSVSGILAYVFCAVLVLELDYVSVKIRVKFNVNVFCRVCVRGRGRNSCTVNGSVIVSIKSGQGLVIQLQFASPSPTQYSETYLT